VGRVRGSCDTATLLDGEEDPFSAPLPPTHTSTSLGALLYFQPGTQRPEALLRIDPRMDAF